MTERIYWAIAYTKRRNPPYVFEDTIRRLRKEAWDAWAVGFSPYTRDQLRRVFGAKAIKIRIQMFELSRVLAPPRCSICGWPVERVTFAWKGGEDVAVLCTNRRCPGSQLPVVS